MIIACEQCETRFQLDETRIPAKGARVRCSRCKHAFFVRRPDASEADAFDEVVAEATGPGASSAPPATRDLDGSAPAGADEFESDWEFNDEEVPPPAAAPAGPAVSAGADAFAARDDSGTEEGGGLDDEDLDALGNPEEWNLLADAPPPAAGPAAEEADDGDPLEELLGGSGSAPQDAPPAAVETTPAPETSDRVEGAARSEAAPRRAERIPGLGAAVAGLGWAAAIALVGVAVQALVLDALRPPRAPSVAPRSMAVGGLGTAHEVRATRLENALAGPILVVSGRLETQALADGRGLEVQLVGPGGEPIPDAAAWAGPPLSELQLRELAPEVLRRELARGAAALAHAGGAFHAVFAEVPDAAADLSLRVRRPPSTSPPATSPPPTGPPSSE